MVPQTENKKRLCDLLILIALSLAVYGRILGHDFLYNWDDNWFILFNDAVRGFSWSHLREAFSSYIVGSYTPLQTVSFMLDYTLWGLHAGGFLATNLLLHTVNGVLIYLLFKRWSGDRLAALAGSALFLLHPVQVESVAWISQRKTLLAMLFFLLAWLQYCRYREAAPGTGRLAYALSLAAFSLSLLAKSITVIMPVALVLYDLCFPVGEAGERRLGLKDKIPFLLAAGAVAAVTLISVAEPGGSKVPYHGGSPLATLYTMLPVFCRYLGMLVWPAGLSSYYAPTIHRSIDGEVVAAFLLLAGVVLAGVRWYRADRRVGFWVLFFFLGLLPVSQIFPLLDIMGDRHLYFPMIGVAALTGFAAVRLRDRLGRRRAPVVCLVVGVPLLAFALATVQRAGVWRDSLTLWSDAVAKEPGSDRAWELLGEAEMGLGKPEQALKAFQRGLALNPSNTEILAGLGEVHTDWGDPARGLPYLQKLLQLKPGYVIGWATLGTNCLKRGDFVEAEKAYRQARKLQPEAMQVVMLQGNLARMQGRLDQARSYYLHAEGGGWNNAETAYQLACVEALAGRREEALDWFEKSLQRGFRDYRRADTDKNLSGIWEEPGFNHLLLQYIPELRP